MDSNARFAAALHALVPRPALALLRGDLVDEGTPAEYANLRKLLGGLDNPSLVIPGNRDDRDNAAVRVAADFAF